MLILGINGGFRQGYQDVCACLVENGQILAAVEEERLNRIKFSPGRLPFLSIKEVLRTANKKFEEINVISFHGSSWGDDFDIKLQNYFQSHFGNCPKVMRYHHHDCHAASAFFGSGYKEALVFTYDSSGDGVSFQVSHWSGDSYKILKRFDRPNSLGIYYSLITQFCGFNKECDEYKLMGLSSYGDRFAFDFSWLIDYRNGELILDKQYLIDMPFRTPAPHRDEMLFNEQFERKLGLKMRVPGSKLDLVYKDIAASAQQHFERVLAAIVNDYILKTGIHSICLAGGAALNCVANQHLMNLDLIDKMYVQPASSDAGISIGAAFLHSFFQYGISPTMSSPYLGYEFSELEIICIIKQSGLTYTRLDNVIEEAVKDLKMGKVIGWFQGKSEIGPRALGNRSILAAPFNNEMQSIVNQKIKFRESFRPFCPSVLEEDVRIYFEGKGDGRFMNVTWKATKKAIKELPAVVHVDGTARIQTVNKHDNLLFYNLLSKFKQETGYGVLLNTSFNVSDEPMVYSPLDAIRTFFGSGLDFLYLGNVKLRKHD